MSPEDYITANIQAYPTPIMWLGNPPQGGGGGAVPVLATDPNKVIIETEGGSEIQVEQ